MKKNLIKSLTLSTATLATFSMANTVLAEDVLTNSTAEPASQATNITSSQELANQVAQAENTVTSTQFQLEQAQQALAEQEKNLIEAQTQLESAQTVADSTAENLAKAEENASQATAENIASAQASINTAAENVAQASAQVATTTSTQNLAQESYNQQTTQVAVAQANLDTATATYQTTQQNVKTTEEEQKQATAKLNQDLSTSQSEVSTFETAISTYSSQLETTKNELNALKNSANLEELKQAQLDRVSEEMEANRKLILAQRQYNKLQQHSEPLLNSQSSITLTTQTPTLIAEEMKHPKMSATIYSGERTETIYITAEQAKEYAEKGTITYVPNSTKITEYFVGYLNELKRLNGMTSTVDASSSDLIAYAVARAEENAARNLLTHQTNLNPADFNLEGSSLRYNEDDNKILLWLENASGRNAKLFYAFDSDDFDVNYPYLSDQAVAYNLLLGWFTDYRNVSRTETSEESRNYGHRIIELTAEGPIGVGVSANGNMATLQTSKPGANDYLRYDDTSMFEPDFITNDKGETVMIRKGTTTPVVFLPAVTFNFVYDKTVLGQETVGEVNTILKTALAKSQEDIASKQATLDEAKTATSLATAAYHFARNNKENLSEKTAEKETEIAGLESNLQTAQTNLSVAKTKVSQLQEKLAQISQDTQLLKLKEQLTAQEKAVQEAQVNLETQQTELSKRQVTLTEATNLTEAAKKELASAQTQLETVKANYQALIKAQENLTLAQKADLDAKAKLAQVTAEVETAETILNQLQKVARDAQLTYTDAKANYDKLLADYTFAKDLEDKSLENIITPLPDGTIIAIPKTSPSVAEKPSLDIEKLLESLKSSDTGNTGTTNSPLDNNAGLNEDKKSQQVKNNQTPPIVTIKPHQAANTQTASQSNQINHLVATKLNQTSNTQTFSLNPRAKVANQTKELPNTGETSSIAYALTGLTLLSTTVLIRKRKEL
ncbi:TPA: LPXTG cell wall anchor domain-containing protein [Streptococcus suis]